MKPKCRDFVIIDLRTTILRANMRLTGACRMDASDAGPDQQRRAFVVVDGGGASSFDAQKDPPHRRDFTPVVSFDRKELRLILNLYGAKVAAGEWRDYAMDFTSARAVFSIYRRASEAPLYRIEKNPDNARKQGAYAVVASGGLILRRGRDLARVIEALDRKLKLVSID
jgi:hypothetical protein